MKKLGFTLAEVLITLVIIGVIAAMTVPTLMNNTNAQEYRSALKKAISGLNQALTLNYALEGLSAQDYSSGTDLVNDVFKRRMSVIDGDTTFTNGCSGGSVFTTSDGMMFCVTNFSSANSDNQGTICDSYNTVGCVTGASEARPATGPNIWIDVNGVKKPNRATASSSRPRDIYQATIYAQKVVPYGDPTQEVMFDKGTDGAVGSTTGSGTAGGSGD